MVWLHEVIHHAIEDSPIVQDKYASFLGLAHDVRRAYERQRQVIQPPKHFEEIGVRYDVRILWPVLWVQHRLLRRFLASYALEAVTDDASREDLVGRLVYRPSLTAP
ncbi:conserved hypothetical protein [Agrobacterium fabacearum S56]|nr:conserved hypothetical protein [Agrobacterium fabacearum S56]